MLKNQMLDENEVQIITSRGLTFEFPVVGIIENDIDLLLLEELENVNTTKILESLEVAFDAELEMGLIHQPSNQDGE